MTTIIQFPTERTKKPKLEAASDILTTEQAVDLLTICMLTDVVKLYIENKWSFAELDFIIRDFRDIMIFSAPDEITRGDVDVLNGRLKGIWREMVESIRSTRI